MTTIIRWIAGIVIVLALWNLAATRWNEMQNPVPGAFYDIDGYQMHLYCTGLGTPTVVIEAGFASDWLGWQTVQPGLSAKTRVCTYDRAGLGWSKPRPRPRNAEAIARQLHTLLDQAGIERPMILLGHSAGALYIREYAREFPAEIAAAVMVDAVSPVSVYKPYSISLWKDRLIVWSGLARLMGRCHETPGKGLERFANLYNVRTCRPEYVDGERGESLDYQSSLRQAARLTTFGDKPLLILSADADPVWDRTQEALKTLSSQSWRVIARGAGHKIYQDRPDLVLAETSLLIAYLQGGAAPPFGTTQTK